MPDNVFSSQQKQPPLRVIIVEDEGLLAMELELLLEDAGHKVVGWAISSNEAIEIANKVDADLALVDIHLVDGPTGIEVARYMAEKIATTVVFMTANAKLIPEDFAGAAGYISKPYSLNGINATLSYLQEGVFAPPPRSRRPFGFTLAPTFEQKWQVAV